MISIKLLEKDLPKGFFVGVNTAFGKSATGKTTLCTEAAVMVLKDGKKAVFVDTEGGFSFDRAKQLGLREEFLDNLVLLRPKSFFEQEECLIRLSKSRIPDLGVIIVDTIGKFYRLQAKIRFSHANESLKRQLEIIKKVSKKLNIPVILANQVYTDIDSGETRMLGNRILERESNLLIELVKDDKRKLIFKKPFPKEISFEIVNEGLVESYLKG